MLKIENEYNKNPKLYIYRMRLSRKNTNALKIVTDNNSQEIIDYSNPKFPLFVWRDDYEQWVDFCVGAHWHSDFEFSVLLSGELDYYLSNQYIRLKKGDCVFVNANALHTATQCSKEKAVMVGVTFKPTVFGTDRDNPLYEKFFENVINANFKGFQNSTENEHGKKISQLIKELSSYDTDDENYELQCISEICRLWSSFLSYCKQKHPDFQPVVTNSKFETEVKQIISYIQNNYMESFTVEDIAKSIGISRSECFKYFREFTTKTPIEYLLEYRLTSAANMLKATEDTVLEICTKCGFSNSSYFGKRFKEQYGVTPLEYRKHNN